MNLDEGLAQAVFTKGPNKEGWSQAEPWGAGVEVGLNAYLNVYAFAHRNTWLWLWEGEQEIVEGGNG